MQHQERPIGFIFSITRKVDLVTEYIAPFLAGWALTLLLLVICHLLWNDVAEEIRYTLGAGAICLGCALTGLILNQPLLIFGPTVVTSAGLVIPLIQHFERGADKARHSAQKNGEIIGMTRGLSQDLIDRGGRHDAEPGMEQTRRRN